MDKDLLILTLDALFSLAAQTVEPSLDRLAIHTGAAPRAVADAMDQLETRGLVDAFRLRLTMRGLAAAAALHAAFAQAEQTTGNRAMPCDQVRAAA